MRMYGKFLLLLLPVLLLQACADRTYKEEGCCSDTIFKSSEKSAETKTFQIKKNPCPSETPDKANKEEELRGPFGLQKKYHVDGVNACPSNRVCTDDALLPPRPCAQPMPTYYNDLTAEQIADGIVLQHPITRAQVICYDVQCESATDCARNFQEQGFVLITDIPQVSANYDLLRDNTYPARRYRNGGELNPRW